MNAQEIKTPSEGHVSATLSPSDDARRVRLSVDQEVMEGLKRLQELTNARQRAAFAAD